MNRSLLYTLFLTMLILPLGSFTQTKTFSGQIVDENSKESIPYVTVVLVSKGSNSILDGTSTNETGNFNITTFSFFQSLKDAKPNIESVLFDEFKTTRFDIARELSQNNTNSSGLITVNTPSGNVSLIDGYGINQQDVLIGAFYQTYTGRKINNYTI